MQPACDAAGVSRQTVQHWRKTVKGFEELYQETYHKATEGVYENAAYNRAINGVRQFVVQKGELVRHPDTKEFVTKIEYSDGLLEKLLEARAPDKYRQKGGYQLDPKLVGQIASDLLAAVRRAVVDTCPHCKTNLNITPRIVEDLKRVCERFDKEPVNR